MIPLVMTMSHLVFTKVEQAVIYRTGQHRYSFFISGVSGDTEKFLCSTELSYMNPQEIQNLSEVFQLKVFIPSQHAS